MSSIPSEAGLRGFNDSKPDAHLAEPSTLRQQHNVEYSKAGALPPEILSVIFGILEYECRGAVHSCLLWYAVTHVCRAWRNIALNDPLLWTDFVDPPPKAARELFSRSKAVPLKIRVGSLSNQADDLSFIYEHVVEHPERIRSLQIHRNEPFLNLLTRPAPFLESLLTGADVEFPLHFIGGAAPRLTSVICRGSLPLEASWLTNLTRLQCQRVYLEAPWLSNLTSLEFSQGWTALDVASGGKLRVNMEIILTVLENTPLLQCLDLAPPYYMDPTPAMIETLCHFFATCYKGGSLHTWLQHGLLLSLHRSLGEVNTPALIFRGYLLPSGASFRPTRLAFSPPAYPLGHGNSGSLNVTPSESFELSPAAHSSDIQRPVTLLVPLTHLFGASVLNVSASSPRQSAFLY